jgi:hypothetical protein
MEEGIQHDNADSLSNGEALQRPTAAPFVSVLIGILGEISGQRSPRPATPPRTPVPYQLSIYTGTQKSQAA